MRNLILRLALEFTACAVVLVAAILGLHATGAGAHVADLVCSSTPGYWHATNARTDLVATFHFSSGEPIGIPVGGQDIPVLKASTYFVSWSDGFRQPTAGSQATPSGCGTLPSTTTPVVAHCPPGTTGPKCTTPPTLAVPVQSTPPPTTVPETTVTTPSTPETTVASTVPTTTRPPRTTTTPAPARPTTTAKIVALPTTGVDPVIGALIGACAVVAGAALAIAVRWRRSID